MSLIPLSLIAPEPRHAHRAALSAAPAELSAPARNNPYAFAEPLLGEAVKRRHVDRTEVRKRLLQLIRGHAIHHEADSLATAMNSFEKFGPKFSVT